MGLLIAAIAVPLFLQVGNPIVTPPVQAPAQTSTNVSVNVTPPPPDPQATAAMYSFSVATLERDHVQAPISYAGSLLSGTNIWTNTPASHFTDGTFATIRSNVRWTAMGLFLLAIIWTGVQMAFGSAMGQTSLQLLLPPLIGGFLLAAYSDTIVLRTADLCNWLNARMGSPDLTTFSGDLLTVPEIPAVDGPAVVAIPAAFFSGLIGSLVYALVLIVLEVKLIFREAILTIGSTVMPISGALWAVKLTHGWGTTLFRLWFGWLFSQPLVVLCLALSGSLLGLLNLHDDAGAWLVKVAILFAAIKAVSIFAGGSLSGGAMFGLAGVLFLLRRAQGAARAAAGRGGSGPAPTPAPAVQPGVSGGTGAGSAASGRPWRPALGAA